MEKEEVIRQTAEALFARNPDWVTFYRKILGLHGVIRRHYPTLDAMNAFEETETYRQVQQMLRKLRERRPPVIEEPEEGPKGKERRRPRRRAKSEPTQVVTVRIPRSLHEALRVEAHEHCTSMNKLCISKLLQFIDNEMVPPETSCGKAHSRQGSGRSRAGWEWTYKPGSVAWRPGRSRVAAAMAISLGGRLLGPSSGLPGSRRGPDQSAGMSPQRSAAAKPVLPV